jgi:hypothetical protein
MTSRLVVLQKEACQHKLINGSEWGIAPLLQVKLIAAISLSLFLTCYPLPISSTNILWISEIIGFSFTPSFSGSCTSSSLRKEWGL